MLLGRTKPTAILGVIMRLVVHLSKYFPCFLNASIAGLLGVSDCLIACVNTHLEFFEALQLDNLANDSQSLKDILKIVGTKPFSGLLRDLRSTRAIYVCIHP